MPILATLAAFLGAATPSAPPPVGMLESRAGLRGTAFLVGPCHALSARHVAAPFAGNRAPSPVGQRLRFRVPDGARVLTSRAVVVAAGTSTGDADAMSRFDSDWMLVRLSRCLGKRLGYVALSPQPAASAPASPAGLLAAGFPITADWRHGVQVSAFCGLHSTYRSLLFHTCPASDGHSGSPLLARSADGRGVEAVAILVARGLDPQPAGGTPLNVAVSVASILPAVQPFL